MTFDEASFPYLTAELGGGLQVTAHRRPVATGPDIGAMSLVKMGSGAGLLGYYMYHGGSNPDGKLTTLQESKTTGYANDLPEINYDFNAPIRQYGTISDSLKEIKLLAYFLQDFGEDMASLPAEIPDERIKPEDLQTLRISCRHDETHGYVFFNNYQRRRTMAEHKHLILEGSCGEETVTFPAFDLKDKEYGFFPYRMKVGEAVLKSALATPLCRLRVGEQETYVFYGDRNPFYEWETEAHADILHLTRKEALNAWHVTTDQDYLILSDNYVWEQDGEIHFVATPGQKLLSYPALQTLPQGMKEEGTEGRFYVYRMKEQKVPAQIHMEEYSDELVVVGAARENGNHSSSKENHKYNITISYDKLLDRKKGEDLLLYMTYDGNGMEIEIGGKKVNDYFYTGQQAVFSLGYFNFPKELTITVHPLKEGTPVFLEKLPEFQNGTACRIREIQTVYQEEIKG